MPIKKRDSGDGRWNTWKKKKERREEKIKKAIQANSSAILVSIQL